MTDYHCWNIFRILDSRFSMYPHVPFVYIYSSGTCKTNIFIVSAFHQKPCNSYSSMCEWLVFHARLQHGSRQHTSNSKSVAKTVCLCRRSKIWSSESNDVWFVPYYQWNYSVMHCSFYDFLYWNDTCYSNVLEVQVYVFLLM